MSRKINIDAEVFNVDGELIKENEKNLLVKDLLLAILRQKFNPHYTKEIFWVGELGKLIYQGKGEIEVADNKAKFIIRLAKENTLSSVNGIGQPISGQLFEPFMKAQVLKALMTDKEIKEMLDAEEPQEEVKK